MPRKDTNRYPRGWNRRKVKAVMDYYEHQTPEQAVAEDEAGFQAAGGALFKVPKAAIADVRMVLAKHAKRGA